MSEEEEEKSNSSFDIDDSSERVDHSSDATNSEDGSEAIDSEDDSEAIDMSDSEPDTIPSDVLLDEPFITEYFDSFEKSFNDECLYPSSNLTVSKSLAILFSWFCSSPGISKEAFSRLLAALKHFILPDGNCLPGSYKTALAKINHLLVPVREYDCCVNDCVVFRKCFEGNYENLEECPKCMELRYKNHTKIARKTFKYIGLKSRLQRLFSDARMSEKLQSHKTDCVASNQTVQDLHQSPAWKSRYSPTGPFQGDARGISLGLCTDGMNPFSREKVQYSMWPIVITVLNLPRSIRHLPGSMFLVGIIPGKAEPKNMDPYLDILVDDILELNGLQMYDGLQKENFNLKIDLFMNVLDYPGQNKVFHCQGRCLSKVVSHPLLNHYFCHNWDNIDTPDLYVICVCCCPDLD